MSRRANPAAIGAFVVGAVAIVVLAILVVGSGGFFAKRYPYVLYFEGGVNGLNVGAPVKFKGVEIGQVTKILLHFDQDPGDVHIPVFIVFDANKFEAAGVDPSTGRSMEQAIERGLRARLESQSFVTGLLYVGLDFYPGSPANFVGVGDRAMEIPTLPTAIEEAQTAIKSAIARLDEIDLSGLVDDASKAATSFDALVSAPETKRAVASLDRTLANVARLSDTLDREVPPLARSVQGASTRADATATELEIAARDLRAFVGPTSPVTVRLVQALDDVSAAARAVRRLADLLERDPSALVRGRETAGDAR